MLKTVGLSLEVLKMFTKDKLSWNVKELAAALDENQTKIYRILETLKNHNFLQRDEKTKQYSLGFSVWELSNVLIDSISLNEAIQPILEDLSDITNESTFLIVLDSHEGLIIDAVESKSSIRYAVSIGSRSPLYAGASYRALLAFQDETYIEDYLKSLKITKFTENTLINIEDIKKDLRTIQQKGFALSESEMTENVTAIAVPLMYAGKVVASLTVSGPSYRIGEDEIEKIIEHLEQAKNKLQEKFRIYGFRIEQ